MGTLARRPGESGIQCSVIPEGHSHDVAITCPSSGPQNCLLAPLALGRPLHLLLAPHWLGPAPPRTHLRRFRAGPTAASQLGSESAPEELGKTGPRLVRAQWTELEARLG